MKKDKSGSPKKEVLRRQVKMRRAAEGTGTAQMSQDDTRRLGQEQQLIKLELRVQERTAELARANELLQAEVLERQKAAAEIQDLYNNAPCGYHSLDPDGMFVRINNTALSWLGYSRDELIGKKKFSDIITAKSRKVFKKSFPRSKEHGIVTNLEFEMVCKDGTILPVNLNATAVTDSAGNYVISRATMFDITQRKREENKLRESEKRLKFLSDELIRAQETERKRIANELHDSIASSLATAILGLGRARRALPENTQEHELITTVITMVKNTVEETRRLMNLLRPPMLDDLGLLPTIRWFLKQYSAIYSGMAIKKNIAVEDAEIPDSMKIDIYRIIQEAFTNIAKHSDASAAKLSLKKKDNVIELTIADNGKGFNPDAIRIRDSAASGLGLVSMKERAQLSGGTLLINSAVEKGTTIFVQWPTGA